MTDTETDFGIVFRGNGAWGTGKGSNLDSAEVDTNFFILDEIAAEELTEQVDAGGIVDARLSINPVFGGMMQIEFDVAVPTDETEVHINTLGPFTIYSLQSTAPSFTGLYVNGRSYRPLEIFTGPDGRGLYIALQSFTGGTEFDPLEETTDGPLARKIWGSSRTYDIAAYLPGPIQDTGDFVFQTVLSRSGIIRATDKENDGGQVYARVAPGAAVSYTIRLNGASVGTMDIAAGENLGTFTFPADVLLAAGDVLDIIEADATTETETASDLPADLSFTLITVRG